MTDNLPGTWHSENSKKEKKKIDKISSTYNHQSLRECPLLAIYIIYACYFLSCAKKGRDEVPLRNA